MQAAWDQPSDLLQVQGKVRWDGTFGCAQTEGVGGRERQAEEVVGRADAR